MKSGRAATEGGPYHRTVLVGKCPISFLVVGAALCGGPTTNLRSFCYCLVVRLPNIRKPPSVAARRQPKVDCLSTQHKQTSPHVPDLPQQLRRQHKWLCWDCAEPE